MKVFIVTESFDEETTILGVFSTEEKAKSFIKNDVKFIGFSSVLIEEFEVQWKQNNKLETS